MTERESHEKPPEAELPEVAATEAAEPEAPAPEPWTPRRVSEWNAYYDIYVAAFVVLLAFLGSANKIQPANSGLWSLLQAGRQIATTGTPVVTDSITIAGQGMRWVNVPWLFELIHYGVYSTAHGLLMPPEASVPMGTSPETAQAMLRGAAEARAEAAPRADQVSTGLLIGLDALVRGITAWLLMGLRRKGPGLWWAAVCATLAVGVSLGPATIESFAPAAAGGGEVVRTARPTVDVNPGGIAGPAAVTPETWGLMFFAIELLLLHHAINLGKVRRLYGLVPLFLAWANMDESYAFGLVALAASVIGLRQPSPRGQDRPAFGSGLAVLRACFAATFVGPSHAFGVLVSFSTMFRALGLNLSPSSPTPYSVFGAGLKATLGDSFSRAFQVYYGALVMVGLLSFTLNRRHFSLGRFLVFAGAAVLWALAMSYTSMFAVAFAATIALNGQEWYHDTFGTEGRLGAGWTTWSTGGRLVTIAVVFLAIASGVTGRGRQVGENTFGFGFNPDDFPFEAAEALRNSPIEGNILNTTLPQGDAIAWRDGGKRKAFVDSRLHLFPRSTFAEFDQLRKDIRDDKLRVVIPETRDEKGPVVGEKVEGWQPALDKHNISAVMVEPSGSPRTYVRLMNSPRWIPFYDDGAVAMFGRADEKAPAADLAYFKANRLNADALAYRRPAQVPPWERPPTPTYEPIDSIFQNRLMNRPQPHTEAARRWLRPADVPPGTSYLPDPAHCLMAIREARTALSIKPDDATAFRVLFEAYRFLISQESAVISGIPLTAENTPRILQTAPQARLLANRFRQLLASMNFAIQTLPPARTIAERVDKVNLTYTLAQLHIQSGAYDLARERLSSIEARDGEMDEAFFKNLTRQLGELNQRVDQVQNQMNDLVINNRASPLDKAAFARSNGAPGLAIHELEEVNDAGANPAAVRPSLVDLYCDAGWPEKALDVIGTLNVDDPTLSTGVGTASHRQGQVYFLLGNYANAVVLWRDKSTAQLRTQRSMMAPMATQMLLNGEPVGSTKMLLELPEKVDLQAGWEFDLGMAALEGGLPADLVAGHFTEALKLEPNLGVRPLIAYYLEKLGKPVPPPRSTTPRATPAAAAPPIDPKPPAGELPPNVFAPEAGKDAAPPKP